MPLTSTMEWRRAMRHTPQSHHRNQRRVDATLPRDITYRQTLRYTLNLNSTQFRHINTSRGLHLVEWSDPRVGRCRLLPSVPLVDARNQPLCMVSELVQRRSVVTRGLQPPQVVAECLRPSHEGIKILQPPLNGVRGPRLLQKLPTVGCPQRPLGVEPDIKPLPLVAELIDESEHRDAQVRQAITDRLGGWVEADEPLHRFLQRRPTSVGGGASRLSKSLLRAPVGPVGADAGDDQGEARDDEGGDVHELIISSARPNARCTTHCRRPAKFADHGGSARASVRPTESSSATCEATPATNMNPEKLWPRESELKRLEWSPGRYDVHRSRAGDDVLVLPPGLQVLRAALGHGQGRLGLHELMLALADPALGHHFLIGRRRKQTSRDNRVDSALMHWRRFRCRRHELGSDLRRCCAGRSLRPSMASGTRRRSPP